jgi:acetylornithine deacetylase
VLWFQVHLTGLPTHVAYAGAGANAIEAVIPLIAALHAMEARWNLPDRRHADYAPHEHALNLNIGRIEGGDWTSSVPAWCVFDERMGLFPGQDMDEARAEIEAVLMAAARDNAFLRNSLPEIVWHGFQAEGYALSEDRSATAAAAIAALDSAHGAVTGTALDRLAITATTDARFFGLYADTPALVYGPRAEAIHGFNERVELDSMRRVTQATALFIAGWCGLEEA